jgi:hypothetical protein
MNRLLVIGATAALALSATAAEAAKKPSPRAQVWNATLAPTSAYSTLTGKVQLVDNKKRDSLKIQLKGALPAGSVYDWGVFRVKGAGAACDPANAGERVSSFKNKELKSNAAGNASATAKSKSFVGLLDKRYAVSVSDANGTVVACGELKRKKAAKKPKKSKG